MRTKVIAVLMVLTLIGVAAGFAFNARPVSAQTPTPAPVVNANNTITRTVSVTGNGEVTATPDQATIYLGVRTEATTSAAALTDNNESMAALIATLRQAGVAARDIQTSDFSIYPRYDYDSAVERITGYEVSNSVLVTVRDLTKLGTILDAAVRAGGNQVSGISFGFNDPAALVEQAREQAMTNAQANADQLATLAGAELGAVVTISEGINNYPTPIYRGAMADTAEASVAIETGSSAVNVSVNVTYEIVVQ